MNSTLINLFIKGFGAKIVRASIAWVVGIAAAHHILLDTSNLVSLAISALIGCTVVVWSMLAKAEPDDSTKEKIKDFIGAAVGLAVPAVFGYLNSKGFAFGPDTDLVTVGVALLSVLSSQIHRPDAGNSTDKGKLKLNIPVIAVLGIATSLLSACSSIQTSDGGTIRAIGSSGSYHNPKSQVDVAWDNSAGFVAATDGAVSIATPGTTSIIVAAGRAVGAFFSRLLHNPPDVSPPVITTTSGK